MRRARGAVAVLGVGFLASCLAAAPARAQVCLPTFGYGNVGYSAGYSFTRAGWCGPRWRGWCGPRWGGWCWPRWGGWCGPGWGFRPWGWRRWCAPPVYSYGSCYGWPAWYGTSWLPSCGSVWMGAPFGGSFFSGAAVPYPTLGYPVIAPGFVSSSGVPSAATALVAAPPSATPASGVPQARTAVATIQGLRARAQAAAVAGAIPRASNAVARLRAARLVAVGDRHLREADGDPARLREAVEAYRRAAGVAADQPDTFVRQAIALVALGDRTQADAALDKAASVDGRLADVQPRPATGPTDPVFGDRAAGSPSPAVARGQAILRQIAAQAGPAGDAAEPPLARIAARWAERFGAADALVARR